MVLEDNQTVKDGWIVAEPGIDPDGSPPCQMRLHIHEYRGGIPCGDPAACRIEAHCPRHGTDRIFACAPHRDEITAGGAICVSCHSAMAFAGMC